MNLFPIACFAALCCCTLWPTRLSAAIPTANCCDPGLKPAGRSDLRYEVRDDRCEGLYLEEVAGGALEVVSFTSDFRNYPFAREKPVLLEWAEWGEREVRVRASGLRRKLYYRMDTVRPAKSSRYTWPAD